MLSAFSSMLVLIQTLGFCHGGSDTPLGWWENPSNSQNEVKARERNFTDNLWAQLLQAKLRQLEEEKRQKAAEKGNTDSGTNSSGWGAGSGANGK